MDKCSWEESKLITINKKRRWGKDLFIFLLLLLVVGCSTETTAKKEAFFNNWETAAKESTGHSPAPRGRIVIVPEKKQAEVTDAATGEKKDAPQVKRLPTEKVTLKMRQADVKAVVRALARTSGQNVLIKNDVKGEVSIDFKGVPWDQAFTSILSAHGLTYVWDGDIIRVQSLEDMEQTLKMSAAQDKRVVQEMEVKRVEPLHTMMVSVDYADAEALKDNIQEFITKDKDGKVQRGSVKVDKHSNSLIIQAIRDDIDRMIPIIEKIDRPTYQIMIKANIVETSKDTARNLGIQWGGMYARTVGNENLYITPGGSGGSATPPGSALSGSYTPNFGTKGISGQGLGVNFPVSPQAASVAGGAATLGLLFGSIGGNILDLQLSALQKDGKLNILSSPSITTLDNQKAFTENGEKVPFVSVNAKDGSQEVKFEDAVLRLEITPHVIDGQNLKMNILVKKDEVDMSRTVSGNPFIIKKQTQTELIVQDGETIVISGLTKQRGSDAVSGVPWLKDIPVLGWLFKGQGKSESMEEVLIFITPKILPQATAAVTPAGGEKPDAGKGP
jgi:type IV pilus assembly protein PilQ